MITLHCRSIPPIKRDPNPQRVKSDRQPEAGSVATNDILGAYD
jgi:hypothetical protein